MKMYKSLNNLIYLNVIVIIFVFAYCQDACSYDKEKDLREIKSIHEDIQIINLLNNLDLRKAQMEFIIKKAQEVKQIRQDSIDDICILASLNADTYEAIKKEVGAGKVKIDREVAKNFKETKDKITEIKDSADLKIEDIALDVGEQLEPFQVQAFDDYRPCIIPIISNGRIGQSSANSGITKILERVKQIPEGRYAFEKERIADYLLEKIKAKYPRGVGFNESEIKSSILNTLEAIRRMNDVDFQVNKEDIAKRIEETFLPEKKEVPRIAKIKKFLLSENITPILKERVNNL